MRRAHFWQPVAILRLPMSSCDTWHVLRVLCAACVQRGCRRMRARLAAVILPTGGRMTTTGGQNGTLNVLGVLCAAGSQRLRASVLVCGAPGGRLGAGGGAFVDRLPTGGHPVTTGGRNYVPMRRCVRETVYTSLYPTMTLMCTHAVCGASILVCGAPGGRLGSRNATLNSLCPPVVIL